MNNQIQASGISCNLRDVNLSHMGWIKRKLENMTNWDKKAIVQERMAEREEGTAPNQMQGQNQQQNQQQIQDPAGQQQHLHINWSNVKPEFSGKPEEDAEAHLLCFNDWMKVHHFVDGVKVQRFCLTLLGEARLWFQTSEPLNNVKWPELQNLFRKRYSKLGNT